RGLLDQLCECLEAQEAACSAHAAVGGGWSVAVHFKAAPDEAAVRALVARAAGDPVARALVFERLAATDWVKASLQGLGPVAAGRFHVHGRHHRAGVARHRIGIEIEAA